MWTTHLTSTGSPPDGTFRPDTNITREQLAAILYRYGGSDAGDADLNGSVSVADAVLALRHAMGLSALTGQGFANADMDGSGTVTTADAIVILRMAMGLA